MIHLLLFGYNSVKGEVCPPGGGVMNTSLLSNINVMNFNIIGPTRALARKAYGPSTDFLFNNFKSSRSFTDYIDYNADQQLNDFMTRYDENSSSLSDVSMELVRLFTDMHQTRDVSVDSDTLTAHAKNSAKIQEYAISVKQLATTQIDTSSPVKQDSTELSDLSSVDLTLNQGDQTYNLSIDTEDTTTNQDVLKKISSSINQSSADIKSAVLSDDEGNTRLSIESTKTGVDASFKISGSFSEMVNLSTLSSARNATYTLNDSSFESNSNSVAIDNDSLQITFNKETVGTEIIKVTLDTQAVDNQFEKLSSELQKISELFNDYRGESRLLSKYERRFNHLMTKYKDELESVGIKKQDDGYIAFLSSNLELKKQINGPKPTLQVDQAGTMLDEFTKFALDLDAQDVRTLLPSRANSNLPSFTNDDFLTYLSFSNRFNISAFYPTGGIMDFML